MFNLLKSTPGMRAITQREWRSLTDSVIGLIFIVIFLVGIGHLTFEPGRGSFFLRGQADLLPFFDYLPWMMCLFIPSLTMRSWAEERKSGTVEFLLTLPLTYREAIWGKFWASWKFMVLAIGLTFPIVITVALLGSPEWGMIFTGYIGIILLMGQMLSLSLFASMLTKSQVSSFILGVSFLVMNLLLDSPIVIDVFNNILPEFLLALIEHLSLLKNFAPWKEGVISGASIVSLILQTYFWLWSAEKYLKLIRAR